MQSTQLDLFDIIIYERDREVTEIMENMRDINELIKDLAIMIESQAEIVDNIDTNIKSSGKSTKDAVLCLQKAENESDKCIIF